MKKLFLVFTLFFAVISSCFSQNRQEIEIRELLSRQNKAWNTGDIDTFMKDYWNSPNLTFTGKNGVTRGWQATIERYKKSYTNKDQMGTLEFDNLEFEFINRKNALVIGSWQLERPKAGDIGGYFTLHLKKIKGNWKIVSDHTS